MRETDMQVFLLECFRFNGRVQTWVLIGCKYNYYKRHLLGGALSDLNCGGGVGPIKVDGCD